MFVQQQCAHRHLVPAAEAQQPQRVKLIFGTAGHSAVHTACVPDPNTTVWHLISNTKPPGVAAGQQDAEALAGAAVRGREEAEAEVERLKDVAAAVQAKVQATADIVARMSGDLERAEVRGCMPPGPSPAAPSSLCCCWPVQGKLQAGARLTTRAHSLLTAVVQTHINPEVGLFILLRPCPKACSSIKRQDASAFAGRQLPGVQLPHNPLSLSSQAEREAAAGDADAARATSKMLEEEVATLKQRLRQTEVRGAAECAAAARTACMEHAINTRL